MPLTKHTSPVLYLGHPQSNHLMNGWLFSEKRGNKAFDSVGQNNANLIAVGSWSGSPWGRAADFNGGTSYANCGTWQPPTNGFTIVARVKMTAAQVGIIASDYSFSTSMFGSFQLYIDQFYSIHFRIHNSNGTANFIGRATPNNTVVQNQWCTIVGTWRGGTSASNIKIFIDGKPVDSVDDVGGTFTGPSTTARTLYIGTQWDIPQAKVSAPFCGSIDSILFYRIGFHNNLARRVSAEPYAPFMWPSLAPRALLAAAPDPPAEGSLTAPCTANRSLYYADSTDYGKALMKFDLSGIPAGATITSATLKLYDVFPGVVIGVVARWSNSIGWSEATNVGPLDAIVLSTAYHAMNLNGTGGEKVADVIEGIQAAVDAGLSEVTIALTYGTFNSPDTAETSVKIGSGDSGNLNVFRTRIEANPPVVDIVYSGGGSSTLWCGVLARIV